MILTYIFFNKRKKASRQPESLRTPITLSSYDLDKVAEREALAPLSRISYCRAQFSLSLGNPNCD